MPEISSIASVRSIIQIALNKNVTDVVLSPGSRNAPLILSFTALEQFNCLSVLDERSAAFIALGMAQQKHKPMLLSCTSGSAAVNYVPAMVEAFYQNIPLIAITADRPAEWIDQGEGQSIRQTQLMDGVYIKNFNLVWAKDADDQWYNERLINEAFETAVELQKPIQINVPLREPLYGTSEFDISEKTRSFRKTPIEPFIPIGIMDELSVKWMKSKSILILVGQGKSWKGLEDQLRFLMDDARVAVATETTANVYHLGFISCIDRTLEGFLNTGKEADFVPDLLITIGGNFISKKLKSFLRRNQNQIAEHWHFGHEVMDTFQSLTELIDANPTEVLRNLRASKPEGFFDFSTKWKSQFFKAEALHTQFLASVPYSDLKVFETLLDFLPDGTQLQMGNSSVVRYVQLFNQIREVKYFGNPGVSGIEGCVSTAVGAALASQDFVVHVSGDHAFRYDSNALAMKNLPKNLRVVVINNGGGNIFRIIPGPTGHDMNEQFIEKVDDTSIQKLVEYHEVKYLSARNYQELEAAFTQMISIENNEPMVVEVFTPRIESPEILSDYFGFIKAGF